jgi:C4-dicarboxylate transporter DctM subunit
MASRRSLAAHLHQVENGTAFIALTLLALLPVIEIVLRFFRSGMPASTEYVQHLVVWIAFVGGMITSREGKHISLTNGIDALPSKVKSYVAAITTGIAAGVCGALGVAAWRFMLQGFNPAQHIGFFPIRAIFIIMPLGYAIMAVRFLLAAPAGVRFKAAAVGGALLVAVIGTAAQSHGAVLMTPSLILLVVCAFFGLPIFIMLGGAALLLFLGNGGMPEVIANEAYSMLRNPIMPTIPLFTLAGFILSESKTGERLVRLFRALFGWLPGGMAIASVLILTFFTTLTGASSVSILALGGLLYFILRENRYPDGFSTGLLTVNGIGTLFAPSLPVVMYAIIAQINIKQMFIGGLLPGLCMVLALCAIAMVTAVRSKVPRIPFQPAEVLPALKVSAGEVLIPIIILGTFLGGLTTLVETAAITVLYVLLLETVIHRDLHLRQLPGVFIKAIAIMGGVLAILSVAKGLSYYIVDQEIPMRLVEWMQSYVHSKFLFLILLNVALLIVGCFMDIFSAIIVVVPLIAPLGEAYGINPVHLGVIFLANLELGYLTPPVGINLFLASYCFNKPIGQIIRQTLPFIVVLGLAVLLITYWPWLTTGLLALAPVQ